MSKPEPPRTPEDFDRNRRALDDVPADRLPAPVLSDVYASLYREALHLIARGHPHPEAIAQACLGAPALDERQDTPS